MVTLVGFVFVIMLLVGGVLAGPPLLRALILSVVGMSALYVMGKLLVDQVD